MENSTMILLSMHADQERRSIYAIIIGAILISITSILALTGNIAVVAAVKTSESLNSKPSSILIANLAIIDMLTGALVMIPCVVSVMFDRWVFGKYCDVHGGLNLSFATGSASTMAFISMDRAIAILYPLHYPQLVTKTVMIISCCWIWLKLLLTGMVPTLMGWMTYDYWEGVCVLMWTKERGVMLFTIYGFWCCFFLPGVITTICNIAIIISARKLNKTASVPSGNNIAAQRERDSARKTTNSLFILILVYFICYTPYSIVKRQKSISGDQDMPNWPNYMSTIVIFFNSATNPFIYGILRKDFRDAFKNLARKAFSKI